MDKWLSNSNVVKVVALAIGILLWVVVHLDVEKPNTGAVIPALGDVTISNVMIQAIYDETQYGIVSIEPGEVTVTLKGDDSKIRGLNPGNLKLIVDLSKQTEGTYELPVTVDSELPKGVSLEIVPSKVKVVMEEKKMKEIPVQIRVTGKPAAGYMAGAPVVNPSRVYISAPSSKIDMAEVAMAEVNIEGANAKVVKKVKLIAYDKNGNEVKGAISPPVLEAEVPVTLPFKTVPLQMKWIGQPAKGYAVAGIKQSVEQITVYGTQDVLDRLEVYDGGEIDLTGLKDNKVFSVEIPLRNKAAHVEPAKVDVTVTIVPSVTKVIDQVPVTLTGAGDQVVTTLVTPEKGVISVTVEGTPGALEKLGPQDIRANVQVGNLPAGKHELPIQVELPSFVKRVDAGLKATVEISSKARAESLPAGAANPSSAATDKTPASAESEEPAGSPGPSESSSPSASPTPSGPSATPSPTQK